MDESTMATVVARAMQMLMARLDRFQEGTCRDEYYTMRIQEAMATIERMGIKLTDDVDDLMLITDLAAWNHSNRDKQSGMPEWLQHKIRGRWLNDDPR